MQKSKKLLSAFMALVMVLTAFPIMAFATNESGVMPADGKTDNQPFVTGTPSQNYRIPGVVTLNDGTIVAVADARWTDQKDGGGNDVIITRSTDGGSTWNYHMLNYFPDNGNVFNKASTSFCDSSIATDGSKVYVLSTFFPAGYAINGQAANNRPWAERAFDSAGRLKLRLNSASTYDYYLDVNTKQNGRYVIRRSTNNAIDSTWTVSEDFYLYNGNTKNGSIFYDDGYYVACKTTYLWFRSSDDGGVTWNAPRLLDVKSESEAYFGVGPGRGLVTSKGDIIFTAYTWNYKSGAFGIEDYEAEKKTQYTYLLSSSDGGYTWKRSSENATLSQWWTSEACPVELPDGTIRCYLRNDSKLISEADAKRNSDGTYTWTRWDRTKVNGANPDTIACWSDCQVSALMYPYKIDGKNAVLVSCPTNNSSERKNGTIHVFFLDDNNNCIDRKTYAVNGVNDSYAYSSMDVLPNGNIALLYESNSSIKYDEVSIHAILPNVTVSIPQTIDVTIDVGESYSFRADTGKVASYDDSILDLSSKAVNTAMIQLGTDYNYNGSTVSSAEAIYDFTASGSGYQARSNHSSNVYVNILNNTTAGKAGCPQATSANPIAIEQGTGSDTSNVYIKSATNGAYLMFFKGNTNQYVFDRWSAALNEDSHTGLGGTVRKGAEANLFRPVKPGETSGTEIPGYVKLNSAAEVAPENSYLIAYKGNNGIYYVMYPSTSNTNTYSHVAKVLPDTLETTGYDITITGAQTGTTVVKVNDTLSYRVKVNAETVAVTGAVKYDPVIYTQGSDYIGFGINIAEGKNDEEMKTAYQVADGWTITGIDVVEGAAADTKVRAEGGILKGTLHLQGGNNSTTVYEKVLLKTHLEGPDGKSYVQQDYLYVTTSPVPAHIVSQSQRYYQSGKTQWVTISNMGLFAKGSTSSYSSAGTSSNDQSTLANSIAPYTKDGMALTSFSYTDENKTRQAVIKTGDKIGGFFSYYSTGGGIGTSWAEATGQTGHYYYDKSSSYNPGIKTSNGNTATIELVLNRPYISNTSDYLHDDNSNDPLDFNEISITVDGTKRLLAQKPDNGSYTAYTRTDVSPKFQTFTFAQGSANSLQTFSVNVDTTNKAAGSTISGNMFTHISHGRDKTNTYWAVNKTTLPFQIHIGDKSALRKPYNKAMTKSETSFTDWNVLIASDYTPSSWNVYQEKMLEATSYLNNYNYKQANVSVTTIGTELNNAYLGLQKIADFSELEKQLELKKSLYNSGEELPYDGPNHNVYTRDSWEKFREAYSDGDQCANVEYADYTDRANAAGYNKPANEGPYSTKITDLQLRINTDTINIRDYPKYAADSTAFEAAKEIVDTLDLDAYKLKDNIATAVTNGDNDIYEPGEINQTVRLPQSSQAAVDQYTAKLLESMNVANEIQKQVNDNATANAYKGQLSKVTFQKNGTFSTEFTYGYGTFLAFTVVAQVGKTPSVTQVSNAQKNNLTVYVTIDDSTSIIPLDSDNQLKLIAQGKSITVNLVTPTTTPTVYVRDYFGTLIYSGSANADQITLDDENATVTVNGSTVNAKSSPAYRFKAWKMTEENGIITIVQTGTRVGGANKITATDATVIPYGQTEPDNVYSGYNVAYTITANSGINPIVWKMTVSNKDKSFSREYLASYGNSFTRANSIYDVEYTPITSEDQLGELASAYGRPISYGDGYISGDNQDKFTLSCFYSSPSKNLTITEAGVLYSTDASMTPGTMTKGANGVVTRIQTKVSDFGQGPKSTGVYTMTKTNALTGTHFMRSYASYTEVVQGATVIRVTYGPVYKCENGVISIVE